MNTFAQRLATNSSWTRTENGADAIGSTGSPLLDLFGVVGALRTRPHDVDSMFEKAYNEIRCLPPSFLSTRVTCVVVWASVKLHAACGLGLPVPIVTL